MGNQQNAISLAGLLLHPLAFYFVGSKYVYSLFSEISLRFNITWCVALSASYDYLIIRYSLTLVHKSNWSSVLSKWKCFWTCLSLKKMCNYWWWNLIQVHFLWQQVWNHSKWYNLCDDRALYSNIPHWIRHSMPFRIVWNMFYCS